MRCVLCVSGNPGAGIISDYVMHFSKMLFIFFKSSTVMVKPIPYELRNINSHSNRGTFLKANVGMYHRNLVLS